MSLFVPLYHIQIRCERCQQIAFPRAPLSSPRLDFAGQGGLVAAPAIYSYVGLRYHRRDVAMHHPSPSPGETEIDELGHMLGGQRSRGSLRGAKTAVSLERRRRRLSTVITAVLTLSCCVFGTQRWCGGCRRALIRSVPLRAAPPYALHTPYCGIIQLCPPPPPFPPVELPLGYCFMYNV